MKTNSYYEAVFNKADELGHTFNDKKPMSPLGQALYDMMQNNNKAWAASLEIE